MKRATVIPSSLSISLISSFCCCWSPEEGVTGSGVKVKSLDGWRRRGQMRFHALRRLCAFGRNHYFPCSPPSPDQARDKSNGGGPFWKHKQVSDSQGSRVSGRTSSGEHLSLLYISSHIVSHTCTYMSSDSGLFSFLDFCRSFGLQRSEHRWIPSQRNSSC